MTDAHAQEPGKLTVRSVHPRQRSVRYRLLAITLLPMLLVMPILIGVALYRWNKSFDALLIAKVNGDLTIAHQYFTRILDNTGEHIDALGRSEAFHDVVAKGDQAALRALLEERRQSLGLDFLYITDGAGGITAASPPTAMPRNDSHRWPVVKLALEGVPKTVVDVFSSADLSAISPELAQRAQLDVIATPNAEPTMLRQETDGMVIHSASPVVMRDGSAAALVGGLLLNHNLKFIDTINDLVYQQKSLPPGSQGTATLFLDDVRVSTNVRLFQGERALGTRVSREVREAVLGDGRIWLDRAFVVNDWYISAYEPITNGFGKRIGMIYVGFLEAPFTKEKLVTLISVVLALLALTALTVPVFLRWASGIFLPLESVTATIARVEAGDLSARTGLGHANDEISRVALHLDDLLDQVQARDQDLRTWADTLNVRVAERTAELEQANRRLEETTQQLIMSEKLAAIGEITAGVAHEVNNPVAVIQGNLDVLRMVLGDRADDVRTEIALIDEQTHRINLIVTKLLQFAHPEEYAGYVDRFAPADVIADCLPLVQHLLSKANISVQQEHCAKRLILMNRSELQQVLVNLIVNAIHAMADGGDLSLRDFDEDREGRPGLAIEVSDTGVGMSDAVMARIFDPFFTTKSTFGTGLGLSISQTLITRQGGMISVKSKQGLGTRFHIWLPQAE